MSLIVIGDGLGSSHDCHVGSKLAVESIRHQLESFDRPSVNFGQEDVNAVWTRAANVVSEYYQGHQDRYAQIKSPLETTLLFVVDLPHKYVISYIGNGSIWLIRGDYGQFLPRRWPWCLTDLLIGHSSLSEDGREVLYGTLGVQGLTSTPHTITVSKDAALGEIILLTTDGVSSRDHTRVGEDGNHKLWQEVDPHLQALLRDYFPAFLRESTPIRSEETRSRLEGCLKKFLATATFDDDATIGCLVSTKALFQIGHVKDTQQ